MIQIHQTVDHLKSELSQRIKPHRTEVVDLLLDSSTKAMNSVPDGVILANSPETLLDALSESEQLLAQRAPVLSLKKYDLYAERFNLYGTSKLFTKTLAIIDKFSRTESRVLLRGKLGQVRVSGESDSLHRSSC